MTPTETPPGTAAATPTPTHTTVPGESGDLCNDGMDNDGDHLIDCADDGCIGSPFCPQTAPATSHVVTIVLALALALAGLAVARKQRGKAAR